MSETLDVASAVLDRLQDLMAFEAPYLIDKMEKERLVASREKARALFTELKKWLVVQATNPAVSFAIYSRRVDEVWHQFVLFTPEYTRFGERFFGGYVHHAPGNAPKREGYVERPEATFDEFRERYRRLFGELPHEWVDELSLRPDSRLLRARYRRPVTVERRDDRAELVLQRDPPLVFVRVDASAAPALDFVARTMAFYVRELPGEMHDDDRVEVCRALMRMGMLRVAS